MSDNFIKQLPARSDHSVRNMLSRLHTSKDQPKGLPQPPDWLLQAWKRPKEAHAHAHTLSKP